MVRRGEGVFLLHGSGFCLPEYSSTPSPRPHRELTTCSLSIVDHTLTVHRRNYTVVNTEKGLLEVQRMSCAGMKLSCQLKVQSSLWTATEVTTLPTHPHTLRRVLFVASRAGSRAEQLKVQATRII